MVAMKANPLASPEELLSLFEKALRVIEPRRKLFAELEGERYDVAKELIHRLSDISDYKKRRDARRNNMKVKRKLKAIAREFKRLEDLPFEGERSFVSLQDRDQAAMANDPQYAELFRQLSDPRTQMTFNKRPRRKYGII